MKKITNPIFLLVALVFASFAFAADKEPGSQKTSNGVGYHAWTPASTVSQVQNDTLVLMADTNTARSNNVKWFSTASLRPAAPILNPPWQDTIKLVYVARAQADSSIVSVLGEMSLDFGVTWVLNRSKTDTIPGAAPVMREATMAFVPDALYRWRINQTSASDSTWYSHLRSFVIQR